ncbi:putative ribonuclease III [Helianthus annuus]|uniref:Ribonuclease III n=1 Tax=Helianthus annuus TaxID=4232 RepID=A0A9K3J056_HELAN|nr:putative ribonuclease III [Helianthus annuus]KAJ0577064.1 putative ribonuclease III [Helianthus annuus]KAJ0584619.1 putative ribonuclease III [Helianthus annuus]KAJ0750286.1 putative ribonuclease III [Helianthus annuus]KAJ0919010.1 putative ribonuclease III [Helianthus annuus]
METQTVAAGSVPDSILQSVDFVSIEGSLNFKFCDRSLLVEAITHVSRPSTGVSCYQWLGFVGDAVLDHLITKHLFFMYTDLPPGCLTDLQAAAVNNENFARVAVQHNFHLHLMHGSSALEKQIRDFVKEIESEVSKPGFNSFGLGDCKVPKVLGDIVESIAGAIFLDSQQNTSFVWKVFQPLLQPMVTPETLQCIQCGSYKNVVNNRLKDWSTRRLEMVIWLPSKCFSMGSSQREGKRREWKEEKCSQTFTRQTLNDICLRRNWPMPLYRCVNEVGPAHAKRFIFAVRVNTSDKGKTLIVVLLIKSVYADLHKQGMKMLVVFLVPKVPLVYQ